MTIDKRKIEFNLLEYLRKMLNNSDIEYKVHPKRLTGGHETETFSFQLKETPENMSKPLVVRVFPGIGSEHPRKREGTVMKYLSETGFPTPNVYFDCIDPSILGGNFIIMDYVPGITLFEYNRDVPRIMAETHLHLHRLDPKSLRKRLISAGFEENTLSGLNWREPYINSHDLNWLKPALKWIKDNTPKSKPAICHGDFHPMNILVNKGKVSGVLDWSLNRLEDPCFDIATTIINMSINGPIILPRYGDAFKETLNKYLDIYQEKSLVDSAKLEYYQAFKCLMMMVEYETGVNVWHTPGILEAIIDKFTNITGIKPIRN